MRVRMKRMAAAVTLVLALAACSKTSDTESDTATSAPSASATDTSAAASPAASVAPTASAAPGLTDIAGVNGETQIAGFAKLGVIDPVSGAFRPGEPVKRREFIRWLVKANNVLWADTPAKRINLADTTEKSAFPDITTNDPDFPYIQGMQDSGYSVGFPNKSFGPDGVLTREQMFSIKNVFDRGTVDAGLAKGIDYARNTAMAPWKDKAQISKTYVPGIATGDGGGATSFALVFGSSSLFRPQTPVTRAQAVVVMSTIGDHSFWGGGHRTLDQALTNASASASAFATP